MAKVFQQWLITVPCDRIVIYSDGSQQDTAVGWGYAIFLGQSFRASGHGRLGLAEVFDAEIIGALRGLQAATTLFPQATNYTICIDSISAISSLQGTPSNSSQAEALAFQRLSRRYNTHIKWCPGHMGIIGNELADEQAKLGARLPLEMAATSRPTIAYSRRAIQQRIKDCFSLWWGEHAPLSYRPLGLKASLKDPPELMLPRPSLHYIIAARSGHGDYASYHIRFHPNSQSAVPNCSCGRQKSPTHIFYCRKIPPRKRIKLGPRPADIIQQTIGPNFLTLTKLIEATGFFTSICPRH
jgi:ribonuclease HI